MFPESDHSPRRGVGLRWSRSWRSDHGYTVKSRMRTERHAGSWRRAFSRRSAACRPGRLRFQAPPLYRRRSTRRAGGRNRSSLRRAGRRRLARDAGSSGGRCGVLACCKRHSFPTCEARTEPQATQSRTHGARDRHARTLCFGRYRADSPRHHSRTRQCGRPALRHNRANSASAHEAASIQGRAPQGHLSPGLCPSLRRKGKRLVAPNRRRHPVCMGHLCEGQRELAPIAVLIGIVAACLQHLLQETDAVGHPLAGDVPEAVRRLYQQPLPAPIES
jgi:hypothetical protein